MKQALKALIHEMEYVLSCINADKIPFDGDDFHEALRLGKEALAQPEQERCVGCEACIDTACGRDECPKGWPKAAQPEQEPVAWWIPKAEQFCLPSSDGTRPFAKAWEPLYTAPPQRKPLTDGSLIDEGTKKSEQEPVAYFNPQVKGGFYWAKPTKITAPVTVSVEPIPLYTTPPQRTWVGLTEEDMDWLHANTPCIEGNYGYRFIRAIEAKLRSKNGY